jgi:hypothetical protein
LAGADCSVIGTSLATQAMLPGYWRASSTSTDVRQCWLATACTGNTDAVDTTATSDGSTENISSRDDNVTTTVESSSSEAWVSGLTTSTTSQSNGAPTLVDDNTSTSSTTKGVLQSDSNVYCAAGYKGPCKCISVG